MSWPSGSATSSAGTPRAHRATPAAVLRRTARPVAAAAAEEGPPLVDLGRGNPEVGPPAHVVEALARVGAATRRARLRADSRSARTKEAIAAPLPHRVRRRARPRARGRARPGHEDRHRRARALARERGRHAPAARPVLPRLSVGRRARGRAARDLPTRRRRQAGEPDLDAAPPAAALYLNYPSNPCAVVRARWRVRRRGRWAQRTGGAIVHDAAYIDLVFDGRAPQSFLATPGAKDVGVEMWSMSKTYGMAGWRIGFVVGNAEIVERVNLLNDHCRVGIFAPLQHAAIAALTGPQDASSSGVAAYERRRDRLAAALPEPPVCEGTFFVWLRLPDGLTAERLLEEHRVAVAPGEGSARAAQAGPGSPRRHRRGIDLGARAARAGFADGRPHEDRDRRPVLVVVLGRGRRALRAPGGGAPPTRARREAPDGQRPARAPDAAAPSAHRAARRPARRGSSPSAARWSCRRTARCRTSCCRRARSAACAKVLREEQFDVDPPARADDACDLRGRARVRAVPDRRRPGMRKATSAGWGRRCTSGAS